MPIQIFDYTDYREYLKNALEDRKLKSNAWSHRMVAEKIGLKSGGHISLILNGKANLKDKALDALISLLRLSPSEGLYFRHMVYYNQSEEHKDQRIWFERMMDCRDSQTKILNADQYSYFSRWYYSAVREALTIFDCNGKDLDELGSKMIPPLSTQKVRESIDLLIRLNLIETNEQGFYKPNNQILSTGPQQNGFFFNEHVIHVLELAREAVLTVPVGQKYNSWVSMAISPPSFNKVVEEIRASRKRILKIIEKDPSPDRVYHLNMNVFPITQFKKSSVKPRN